MEIYEALYTTCAMRRLKSEPIPYDTQARILDAAIRAPNIGQQWRFLLADDQEIKTRLAHLYHQAWERLFSQYEVALDDLLKRDSPEGRMARSGQQLAQHFHEVPCFSLALRAPEKEAASTPPSGVRC